MKEKWLNAQRLEREHHAYSVNDFDKYYAQYFDCYRQYFAHLGISFDLRGKSVVEIGGGPYPALPYCLNYEYGYIVDPIEYATYSIFSDSRIKLRTITDLPKLVGPVDEVWLFNCLQHVEDPNVILKWCVQYGKTIRYFEPINLPTDSMHLHTLTPELFDPYFHNTMQIYKAAPDVKNFHQADCIFGVFRRDDYV